MAKVINVGKESCKRIPKLSTFYHESPSNLQLDIFSHSTLSFPNFSKRQLVISKDNFVRISLPWTWIPMIVLNNLAPS